MSRLTIDVTDLQHQALKATAALQGKTLRDYALEKLFPPTQDEAQALGELKGLLAQRIAEAQGGAVDTRTLTQIAEEAISTKARA